MKILINIQKYRKVTARKVECMKVNSENLLNPERDEYRKILVLQQ